MKVKIDVKTLFRTPSVQDCISIDAEADCLMRLEHEIRYLITKYKIELDDAPLFHELFSVLPENDDEDDVSPNSLYERV